MKNCTRSISIAGLILLVCFGELLSEHIIVSFKGRTKELPVKEFHGSKVFALDELTKVLGGKMAVSGDELKIRWEFAGETLIFSHGSHFYRVGKRVYNLPIASGFEGGTFCVSVRFLTHHLQELFPDIFNYDGSSGVLRDIRDFAHLRSFKVVIDRATTSIELLTTSQVKFALDNSRPGSFLLNLYNTRISSAIEDSISQAGYIDSVKVVPYSDGVQLVFYLDERAERYRVAEITQPTGLRIDFKGKPSVEGEVSVVSRKQPPEIKEVQDRRMNVIMIDPGHGGKDPGAVAGRTLMEKDINLKVSILLAEMLEREGFEVLLTREDDSFIPLSTRTDLANENGADLFVSIHCNSSKDRNLKGFEVYFLSEAKTDEERAVAHRENLSLRYERPDLDSTTLGDIQFIFWDLAQNEFLAESYECAQTIVGTVSNGIGIERSQVKQAGFYVLNGVYMPSVLIELAYISNPEERKLLSGNSYLKKVAGHLLEGITSYIKSYNHRVKG
ncbi:MAG: N-acetylmuramoyl-L-alanine amidase [Candidatus Glassbacteria bacterium]